MAEKTRRNLKLEIQKVEDKQNEFGSESLPIAVADSTDWSVVCNRKKWKQGSTIPLIDPCGKFSLWPWISKLSVHVPYFHKDWIWSETLTQARNHWNYKTKGPPVFSCRFWQEERLMSALKRMLRAKFRRWKVKDDSLTFFCFSCSLPFLSVGNVFLLLSCALVRRSFVQLSEEDIVSHAHNARGLISMLSDPINSRVIRACPNLKIIAQVCSCSPSCIRVVFISSISLVVLVCCWCR